MSFLSIRDMIPRPSEPVDRVVVDEGYDYEDYQFHCLVSPFSGRPANHYLTSGKSENVNSAPKARRLSRQNNVKYRGMETLKNSDGIPLEPPYEKDGKWLAEDGRGRVLDFDTYEEAVDFQKGLTPDSPDRVVLFSDED